MDSRQQIKSFEKDLNNLVNRYRDEYDMVYAEMVGTLHMKAYSLRQESSDPGDDEEKASGSS